MEDNVKYLKQVAHFSEDAARTNAMFKSDQLQMDVLTLNTHQYISPLVEPLSDMIYFVLWGEGVFEVGDEVLVVRHSPKQAKLPEVSLPLGLSLALFSSGLLLL